MIEPENGAMNRSSSVASHGAGYERRMGRWSSRLATLLFARPDRADGPLASFLESGER